MDIKDIVKYINHDQPRQRKLANQMAYYRGRNPSILADYPKEEPDNRIPVPFARRAVNMVTGYLGKEGNIVYSGDGYDKSLQETFDANDEGLRDLELLSTALIHGEAWELHWTEAGKDKFAQIPTYQAIPIYSRSLKRKLIGFIRAWSERDGDTTTYYIDYYDDKSVSQYSGKSFDTCALDTELEHGYGRVPVVRFTIDANCANLYDHVTDLIDFYDKIISEDYANELARFASSYMLMSGQLSDEVDETTGETEVDKIKRSRLFQNLNGEKSVLDQIAFLTKDVNSAYIDSAADRVERLIYEMLQLFNPNDDTFVQASGVAQKYKLLGFEYLCTSITTYFSIGLQDRIALIKGLSGNLSASGVYNTDVTIKFTRNLPDDLAQIAQIAATLKDILSDETILKLFPSYIVPDVDDELARVGDQKESNIDIFQSAHNTEVNNAEPGA